MSTCIRLSPFITEKYLCLFNNMNRKPFLIALSFFCCFQVFAQQGPWSLQQCIEYAQKNNLQVKQSELGVQQSELTLLQNKASILPNLNFNANNFYNFGQTIDPFTNTFATSRVRSDRYSLSAGITLFNGLQQYNSIRQSEMNNFASKLDLERTRNDLALNIALAYLQVLFNAQQINIWKNQTGITKQQLARTNTLVEAGSLAVAARYDLEAQLANEELQLVNANNSYDLALLNLALQLDLKSTQGFSVLEPVLDEPHANMISGNPEDYFVVAGKNHPAIKGAEMRVKAAQTGLQIAKGAQLPTFTMGGSIGSGYSGAAKDVVGYDPEQIQIGSTQLGDKVFATRLNPILESTPYGKQLNSNFNKSFGFQLSMPLFNGLSNYTGIQRAKVGVANAELNLETAKRDLRRNIAQAHNDAVAALKKFEATRKATEAAKQTYGNNEKRYNLGALSTFEFNDSKNKLTKAESDLLQARYDFFFRVKVLDFYQGKPLNL
jgi:outer membrane protein